MTLNRHIKLALYVAAVVALVTIWTVQQTPPKDPCKDKGLAPGSSVYIKDIKKNGVVTARYEPSVGMPGTCWFGVTFRMTPADCAWSGCHYERPTNATITVERGDLEPQEGRL